MSLDVARIHYGEIALLNVHGGTTEDAKDAFNLIVSGEVETQRLLSAKLSLNHVEEALQLMMNGEVVKVEIQPEQ